MNSTMHEVLQFGFQNALVATVLALGVCLVTRFWRNPLLGRTLWLLVLIKLVTPPLWQMPLRLPAAPPTAHPIPIDVATGLGTPATAPTSGWIDDGVSPGPAGARTSLFASAPYDSQPRPTSTQPAGESTRQSRPLHAFNAAMPTAERTADTADNRLAAAFATLAARLPDVSPESLIAGVWLSGSLIVLLLIARRTWRFAGHLRLCPPASATEREAVDSLARRIGLRRTPDVRISAATHPPLVWCLGLRPVLVLPRRLMQQLSVEEQTTVLAHELAHLRRGDHLVRLLEAAVITLFWWHPVAWWARRELQRCEEQCCDAEVLRICPDSPETYVNVLVKTVEFLQTRRPVAVAFTSAMAQKHSLVERIERILGDGRPARWSWASRLTAFALVALLPLSIGIGDDTPADVERSDQDPPSAVQPAAGSAEDSTTDKTTAATVSEELEEHDTPHKRLGDTRPDGSRRVIAARQRQLVPFDRPYGELGFPEGQYGPHWETVRLATHAAVQDELGLTNQQRRRLTPVYTSLMQKDGEWSRGGERPNLLKEEYDRTRSILTDEQKQRLEQIIIRRLGFAVFLQPQYAEQIGLTPEQSEQFLEAWIQHVERAVAGWDGNEGWHAYQKLQVETFATLSQEQRQRYAKLIGDPVVETAELADAAPPRTAPPERTTLMPEFVNEVLYWLPTDTETLIVSRDFQARTIRDDANWKKSLAEPDAFRTLTRSLAAVPLFDLAPAVQELFTGEQIEWAILGGRNYEFTSAFGGYRFDGCTVLRFAEPIFAEKDDAPDAQPLMRAIREATQDRWRIAQNDVFVFPVNAQQRESWVKPRTGEGLYLAMHDDHTMILATSDVYLLQTLRRIDGEGLDRTMPATLPEWKELDFSAGTWGIRRVPERTATGEPTTVSSVTWRTIRDDQPNETIAVMYRPRGKADLQATLRQHWFRLEGPETEAILGVRQHDDYCMVTLNRTANAAQLLPALLFPIQGLPATSF